MCVVSLNMHVQYQVKLEPRGLSIALFMIFVCASRKGHVNLGNLAHSVNPEDPADQDLHCLL